MKLFDITPEILEHVKMGRRLMKWECSTALTIRLAAHSVMEYWQDVIKASTLNTSTPAPEQRKSMSNCTSLASTTIVNIPAKPPL
ncbi:hypothetical protein QYF36_025391 [Acer negundo]|nr:hypothetical protein QYF36_025391 [Acer negundo]